MGLTRFVRKNRNNNSTSIWSLESLDCNFQLIENESKGVYKVLSVTGWVERKLKYGSP